MPIAITWHGHATFTIEHEGTTLLIDPFLAPDNPVARTDYGSVSADYILLTHGHGDHVAHAVPIAKRTGAMVIANFEIATWLGHQGVEKVHGQHLGGGFTHLFGHVKMIPALHGSMLPDGSNGGMPGGFLLTLGDKKVYITGDTALFSDMALVGAHGVDIAIMPIGDNFTMGPDDSLLAIGYIKPRVVIPCHYNTWPPIAVDVAAWAERVSAETQAEPVVFEVDEQVVFD
jgi:L-ascorbate metabolism protein UlaG (beta-lactamase superfamily)